MVFGLASEAAMIFGALAAVAATCAYVTKVARDVSTWRQEEQGRNSAVDAVLDDWRKRGITPEGAVREATRYRNSVDLHTSAITDNTRRIDGIEVRLGEMEIDSNRTIKALQHLNDRFDDTDRLLREAIDEQKGNP